MQIMLNPLHQKALQPGMRSQDFDDHGGHLQQDPPGKGDGPCAEALRLALLVERVRKESD